jgi:hypothetical protein
MLLFVFQDLGQVIFLLRTVLGKLPRNNHSVLFACRFMVSNTLPWKQELMCLCLLGAKTHPSLVMVPVPCLTHETHSGSNKWITGRREESASSKGDMIYLSTKKIHYTVLKHNLWRGH